MTHMQPSSSFSACNTVPTAARTHSGLPAWPPAATGAPPHVALQRQLLGVALRTCDASLQAASDAAALAAEGLAQRGDCPEVHAALEAAERLMANTVWCIQLTKQLAAGHASSAGQVLHTLAAGASCSGDGAVSAALARACAAAAPPAPAPAAALCEARGAAVTLIDDEDGSEEVLSAFWPPEHSAGCSPDDAAAGWLA